MSGLVPGLCIIAAHLFISLFACFLLQADCLTSYEANILRAYEKASLSISYFVLKIWAKSRLVFLLSFSYKQ